MKKIIGVLCVAIFATMTFFSVNNLSGSNSDVSLANLININVANAEDGNGGSGLFWTIVETTKQCAAYTQTVRTYYKSNGTIDGKAIYVDGLLTVAYTGSLTSYTTSTNVIPGHTSIARICPTGWEPFCTTKVPCTEG